MPRLQALLQAFKRFTGTPALQDTSFGSLATPLAGTTRAADDDDEEATPGTPYERLDACATTPISVVITNCRGPESTARYLAAALAQRFDPQSFEVIVVDDSMGDEVRDVVQALAPVGGAPVVRCLRTEGSGPIAARNQGWRAATGVLIAFTDDRSLPDPDWLAGGERAMRAGHMALGSTVCVPASKTTTPTLLGELSATSAFVRRQALERMGGFDERCATV